MRVRGGLVAQFLYRCSCQCADRWWGAPGCGFPGATAPESAGGEKRRTPLQMVAKRDEPGASDDPDHSRRRPGPVAALSPNRKIHNDPISCADPRLFVYRFDGERPSAQEIGLFRFFPVGPSFSSPFPWATGWGLTTRPAEAALPRGAPCGYPIPALLYCAIRNRATQAWVWLSILIGVSITCELGRPDDDRLVFPGETTSGYLSPTTVLRHELYPAMKAAKVPREGPTGERRTFHSFRHTYAKRALENGRRITWLSRHLGHSSLKVTTDVYGHFERAERRREAELMEGVFGV
jgi:hypothetical protein